MSKLDRFKARASAHGQNLTIHPFSAYPTGDYLDTYSNHPDPDDADYPGSVPAPAYGDAATVSGFVQPARAQDGGEVYVRAEWGEEVHVSLVAYVPGDQALTHKDKVVIGGTTYWVAQIGEHKEGSTVIFRKAMLTESVPNG